MSYSLPTLIRHSGTVQGNDYMNSYLGLSFSKPPNWYFLSEVELSMLPDSQKYELDHDFVDDLFVEVGLPLVSLNSSRSENETVPQADVWIQTTEEGPDDLDVVGDQFETFAGLYSNLLKEFEFEEFPASIHFCGRNASVCTTRFMYEGASGLIEPVRVKSLLVPVNQFLLSINVKAAVEVWNAEVAITFETFLGSFKLSPPES